MVACPAYDDGEHCYVVVHPPGGTVVDVVAKGCVCGSIVGAWGQKWPAAPAGPPPVSIKPTPPHQDDTSGDETVHATKAEKTWPDEVCLPRDLAQAIWRRLPPFDQLRLRLAAHMIPRE
jgi:hypothetical protein